VNISHGQAHRRFTDRELVSGLVAQGDSRNVTVVLCLRCTPLDDRSTFSKVIVDGDRCGHGGELRSLGIADGDLETGSAAVAVNIFHRVGHRGGSLGESLT